MSLIIFLFISFIISLVFDLFPFFQFYLHLYSYFFSFHDFIFLSFFLSSVIYSSVGGAFNTLTVSLAVR